MRIFRKKKIVLTCAVMLLAVLGGCDDGGVFEKAQRCADSVVKQGACETTATAKNDADSQASPSSEPSPTPVSSPSLLVESRVYLDASESMRGFSAPKENNRFLKLLGNIGYAMPNCRLFKYGTQTGKNGSDIADQLQEIRFSKAFESEAFYNLQNNQDDLLINALANEEKPVRSVLITDGVYSSPGAELQSETVRAIENWLKRGRFFGILVFKSPFKGRFWSENKRNWLENANVENRPFYAFVFSPDETGFVELRDKLKLDFPDTDVVAFPREAARCEFEPQTRDFLDQRTDPPASRFYLYYYSTEIFNETNSADLFYKLNCQPAENYPVEKFVEQVNLDYYSWETDGFKENKNPPVFRIEYQSGASKTNPSDTPSPADAAAVQTPAASKAAPGNLKISFNKEPRNPYSLYRVTLNLSGGNNLLPKIRGLSTQDDAVQEDMDKTYRFYEFIAAVTTIHLQTGGAIKLPPPSFVVFEN